MSFIKSALISVSALAFTAPALADGCNELAADLFQADEIFSPKATTFPALVTEVDQQPSLVQDLIVQGITAFTFADELTGAVTLQDILQIPDQDGTDLSVVKIVQSSLSTNDIYRVEIGRGDNGMISYFEHKGSFVVSGRTVNNIKLIATLPDGDLDVCNL